MYSESSAERHLTTIQLPSSDKLSPEEMLARAIVGYDRRLASEPDAEGAWEGKALLLQRFGKTSEAVAVCNDWIDRQPAYWRPRFLTAHLRSRVGNFDDAGADFSKWVESNQNFPHFIYLFLFNLREGNDEAALAAVGRASEQPFLEPPKCSGNKFYLGHNAAVFAFAQEDYTLCIAMCDKMLVDERREVYWRQKILVLKAAAHVMLGEEQPARDAVAAIPNPARFGITANDASRHRRFLEAIKCADTDFLRDYTNWKNEGVDWFSPVDMYDSLLYRSGGPPLLYREDWRDNVGF
jgi:tetratricopeptide (TPR) repeat protein